MSCNVHLLPIEVVTPPFGSKMFDSRENLFHIPSRKYRLLVKILGDRDNGKNIQLLRPTQLNVGYGPTFPQKYYALLNDGTIKPYYKKTEDDLLLNPNTKYFDSPYCITTWKKFEIKSEEECIVCLEKPVTRVWECLHACTCDKCSEKLSHCPYCQQDKEAPGPHFPLSLFLK